MALIIGLCLAAPLEIRVMQTEIDAVLETKRLEMAKELKPPVETKFAEEKDLIEKRRKEVIEVEKKFISDIDTKEKSIQEQVRIMNDEAAGKRGSGANIGPKYRAAEVLKNELIGEKAEIQRRYDEEKPRIEKDKTALDAELDKSTLDKKNEFKKIEQKAMKLDGLVLRVSIAHSKYPVQSALLSLLLIIIEIAPIFFKMMLPSGPYDLLVENQRRLTQARYAIEKHSAIHSDPDNQHHVGETFHQAEMLGSYEIGNLAVQKELAKKIQDTYLQKTKDDVDKNPGNYLA